MLQSHANWQRCHHKLTKQAAVGKLQNNLRDKNRQNNPRENRLAGVTKPLKRRWTEPNPTGSPLPAFFTIFLPPAAMLTTSCGKRTHFAFHPDKAVGGGGGQNHQLDYLVLSNVSRHFTACSKPCAGGSSSTEHLTSVKLNCFAIFLPLLLQCNWIGLDSNLLYLESVFVTLLHVFVTFWSVFVTLLQVFVTFWISIFYFVTSICYILNLYLLLCCNKYLLQVLPPPLNIFLSQTQLLCNHFAPPAALHKCNVNIFNNDLQLWGFFALDLKYAKINMPPWFCQKSR